MLEIKRSGPINIMNIYLSHKVEIGNESLEEGDGGT